jgi:hypothetical protein
LHGEKGFCVDPATIKDQVYRDGLWRSAKEFTGVGVWKDTG